ncbi:MAG: peptidase M28, partial [Novosphingobium sp.]|nr:peptidase M28 [Novosphingobium sp.]
MRSLLILLPLLASSAAHAAPEDAISEARLRADVERLVSFGTRHTLSSQTDPKRGIGAARKWAESEFRKTSAACNNCLEIVLPETVVGGDRVPLPTRLID